MQWRAGALAAGAAAHPPPPAAAAAAAAAAAPRPAPRPPLPAPARALAAAAAAAAAAAQLALCAAPTAAAVPLVPPPAAARQREALEQLGLRTRARGARASAAAAAAAAEEAGIQDALRLMAAASDALDRRDWAAALELYSRVVDAHGGLALAERARVGRALLLYEAGDAGGALLGLEDATVALRGDAQVHAALAAVLWAERPGQRARAEQAWDVAMEFDRRYGDREWVARERRWPPRMLAALDKFLALAG